MSWQEAVWSDIFTEVGNNWAKVMAIIDDNSNVSAMVLSTFVPVATEYSKDAERQENKEMQITAGTYLTARNLPPGSERKLTMNNRKNSPTSDFP